MSFETIQNIEKNLKHILIDMVNKFLINNESILDIHQQSEMTELMKVYLSELSFKKNINNVDNILHETQQNQYIYIRKQLEKLPPIEKKSCFDILHETLRKFKIIGHEYNLRKEDLLNIIISIDNKLIKESIILYMGYYLNNILLCDKDNQSEKILNDILINKFYTNDIHFFESLLINEIHLNNNLFNNILKNSDFITRITIILKDLHMMLKELVDIPLKLDTKVYINPQDVLNDSIIKSYKVVEDSTIHKIYKIKKISVDRLLPYCEKYDNSNPECLILLPDELDKLFKSENVSSIHNYESNDLCPKDKYTSIIKKRNVLSGGIKSNKCPETFMNIPDVSILNKSNTKDRLKDGWEEIIVNPNQEYNEQKSFYRNEYMCQLRKDNKDIILIDNLDTIENSSDTGLNRKTVIQNNNKNMIYNLYRDEECISTDGIHDKDENIDKFWFYEADIYPVEIPTEIDCNNINRKTFCFNKLDVESSIYKINDNKKLTLSTCISLLWYYKIYEEYMNVEKKTDKRNYDNSRIHDFIGLIDPIYYLQFLKNYILEQILNRFDEETLSFFIILGSLMYISSHVINKENISSITHVKPFHLFNNSCADLKLNNQIKNEIYRPFDRNYISLLENIIPMIINSKQLDDKIKYRDVKSTKSNTIIDQSLLFFIESTISKNVMDIYFNNEYLLPLSKKNYIEYISHLEQKKILIINSLTHENNLYKKKKIQEDLENTELSLLFINNQMLFLEYHDDFELENDYTDKTEYYDIYIPLEIDDTLFSNNEISITDLIELQKIKNSARLGIIHENIADFK